MVCDLVTLGKTQFFKALAGENAFANSWRRQNTQLASKLIRPENPLFREDLKGLVSEELTAGSLIPGEQGSAPFCPEQAVFSLWLPCLHP